MFLSLLWKRLTDPHPSITDFETQRKSRLLSGFIAVLLPMILFYLWYMVNYQEYSPRAPFVILTFCAAIALQYALNRSGRYRLAAWLFVGTGYISFHALPLLNVLNLYVLFYTFISLLLSAILLSAQMTIILFGISLLSQGAAWLFLPQRDIIPLENADGIFFTLMNGGMVLIYMIHRNAIENERRLELQAANNALRQSEGALEQRVEARTRELELASETSRSISTLMNLNDLLNQTVKRLQNTFGLYLVSIFLYEPFGRRLTLRATTDAALQLLDEVLLIGRDQNLVTEAAERRELVLVNDVTTVPLYRPHPLAPLTRSELSLPLLVGGALVGVLDLESEQTNRFTADDQRAFGILAGQIAIALNNARLFEATERSRRTAALLATTNLCISQATEEQDILAAINEIVAEQQPDTISMSYIHYDNTESPQRLEIVAVRDREGNSVPLDKLPFRSRRLAESPMMANVLGRGETVFIEDISQDERWSAEDKAALSRYGGVANILLPLRSRGRSHATIRLLWNTAQTFSPEFREMISTIIPRLTDNIAGRRAYLAARAARDLTERLYSASQEMNAAQHYSDIVRAVAAYLNDPAYNVVLTAFEGFDLATAAHFEVLALRPSGSAEVFEPHNRFDAEHLRTWVTDSVFVVNDLSVPHDAIPTQTADFLRQSGVGAFMYARLQVGTRIIGGLNLTLPTAHEFTSDEIEAMRALGQLCASALDRIWLYAEQVRSVDQLRLADQMKSQFLASMSHELRTPLNAILNFTEFVSMGVLGPVTDEQVDALGKALSSGRHLLALINDVLDVAKIQAGKMKMFLEDNVNLEEEIKTVIAAAESLLKNKPLRFIQDIDTPLPRLRVDRRRIRQILLNLLSNAVKFTEKGSITLSVKRRAADLLFAVIDTGPGVRPEDQSAIFEAFLQSEEGVKAGGGTGLGLPISRSLAEAHGGRLWLESEVGEGASFFFSLPLTPTLENDALPEATHA
ncbi:MAG TPA: GAF domain-containing protein [Aggregatilineales bacterium]|nr:GAF domain-containing protein [Anaerolineales bacterium]HRE49432.1 GAF domain-containing protein [Aggregatilineales bacterium]